MSSVLALVIIILISFLVVRAGTTALVLSGMSYEAARFQSISAFFGVGFTTSEAEMVMQSEIRRRIIRYLIVAGNIGLTSALATLIMTLSKESPTAGMTGKFFIIGVTTLSVLSLGLFFNVRFITNPLDAIMRKILMSSGVARIQDYETLLKVEHGYCVSEFVVMEGHPWAGKALFESRPSDNEVVILNILHSDGEFTGAPNKSHIMKEGDEVMVYGAEDAVRHVANLHISEVRLAEKIRD